MFFNWIGPLAYFAYGRKDSPFRKCDRKDEQPAVIEETTITEETAEFGGPRPSDVSPARIAGSWGWPSIEARRAAEQGEVPIGAVLVLGGEIVASRGNERERRHDPTAHAEMLVLRDAAAIAGGWRLSEATLYVTLEPCAMCAGAIVLARIKRLVWGADDPKAGAAGSIFNIVDHPALNHSPEVRAGVMEAESSQMLRDFFACHGGDNDVAERRRRMPCTGRRPG